MAVGRGVAVDGSVAAAVVVGGIVAVGGGGVGGSGVAVGRGVVVGGNVAVAVVVGGIVAVGGGEAVGVAGRDVAVGWPGRVGAAGCPVGDGGIVATGAAPEPVSPLQAVSKHVSPKAASSGTHRLVRITTGISPLQVVALGGRSGASSSTLAPRACTIRQESGVSPILPAPAPSFPRARESRAYSTRILAFLIARRWRGWPL